MLNKDEKHIPRRKKVVDDIIDMSFSLDEMPEGLSDMIQLWMADGNDRQVKEEALMRVFDEEFNFASKPGKELRKSLPVLKQKLMPGVMPVKKPLYKKPYFKVVFMAVMIAVIFGISFSLLTNKGTKHINSIVVSTEPNCFQKIDLPDGSEVWLGENSTIEYPENFSDNRVVTFQGEAYFSVAKLDGKPFDVTANNLTIHVLGTEFLLKTGSDNGKTEVSLASGKLEVTNNKNNIVYELSPREQLLLDNITNEVIRNIVDDEYIARYKTTERTPLQRLTLKDAFTEIANKYNVRFKIETEENILLNTKIRINVNNSLPLHEILDIIQTVAEHSFNYTIEGDTVNITKCKI